MTKEPVSPYKMNLPTALKGRIEEAAHQNRRSVSAEIIAALEEAYPEPIEPAIDVELATMTEWLEYVDSASSEEEFQNRLSEVNLRLRHSKSNRGFMIKVLDVEDGMPHRTLIIARAGFPDPSAPLRYQGRTIPPPKTSDE